MPPNRRRRLSKTCVVTRPPSSGQSGVTTVATDLACSVPYPLDSEDQTIQRAKLATMIQLYELLTAEATIEPFDTLVTDGRTFSISYAVPWKSSRHGRGTVMRVIAEELNA